MNYLDFEVKIQESSKGITVSARSPMGEAEEPLELPFSQLELESHLQKLQIALLRSGSQRRRILTPEFEAVQNFGQALFHMLLSGQIYSLYYESQREAARQGKGLRLRLTIDPPHLAALPWEFLYDSREAEYVCLSRNTPLVRYLDVGHPPQELTVAPPLRILGMVANPSGLVQLNEAVEKERMERALATLRARGLVALTWLDGQTWQDLQRIMRAGPWHVFHFAGHGGFDETRDEGLIMLADEQGKPYPLTATQLGRLLDDHRSLRLVVLNTCESARGGNLDIFASTAATLIRRGLPAVLAMQYEISDQAAIGFSQAFYEALADGLPVDSAVAEARKAVSFAAADSLEWGTPVLYLRAPTGRIFAIENTATPPPVATKAEIERGQADGAASVPPTRAATEARQRSLPLGRQWGRVGQTLLALLALAVLIGGGYLIYRAIGPVDEIDGRDDRPVAQRSPAAPSVEEEPGNAEPNSTPTGVGEESRATATAQRQATLRAHTPQAESVPTPLRPANVSQSGEGVTVALVGTGVDNSHPDLSTRVLAEQDFTRTGTADVTGHDTVLAGIVAGSGRASDGHFVGVAPGARLYVARVIGDNGAGSESDLLAGLRWAVDQQPDILLFGLGSSGRSCDESDALAQAARAAVDAGIVVVAPAGTRSDAGIDSPGCTEQVITVGSSTATGSVSPFSGRGPTVTGILKPDLVAPGEQIMGPLSTASGATASRWDADYTELSGTSAAAAYVAGVVALMLEANPDLTPTQVKFLLRRTAQDLGEDENAQGAGLVDADAAVAAAVAVAGWDDAEEAFYREAVAFALSLDIPAPLPAAIVFDPDMDPQVIAYWRPDPPHYRVSPERLDLPGVPQYVALSGWFLSIQPASCPGDVDVAFQNEFRWSLTSYLISTDPTVEGVAGTDIPSVDFEAALAQYDLARRLQAIENGVGAPEPVRQLALAMLRAFDCDWTAQTLHENIVALNQRQNLVPAAVLEATFSPTRDQ